MYIETPALILQSTSPGRYVNQVTASSSVLREKYSLGETYILH
jgi:hypothetical protein